ncbi:helix-turn-helix domain-containing protein [Cytophagaceae bacterium ABcell3]|nr:helix-turn-helix domain-containing protein [Cytophagaceae bacterium ABcell3]
MQADKSNRNFELAVKFVNHTSKNLFLTGKAGTGKTTFLRYIKENTHKKHAIVAPTGIAAMNAGGVTIHSFFQLPFGSFVPLQQYSKPHDSGNLFDRHSLMKHLRLRKDKRELMQEIDLLIIDEVSMLRADLLDAIDTILRHVRRRRHIPFGGVQMLFIGDLFQLPPVTAEQEWKVLQEYYPSPFFFHAHGLQEAPPVYLELKKIYRQKDVKFITLLNNLRNNKISNEDLELLKSYYQPNFKPHPESGHILLTTHNAKADIINQEELDKLPGKAYTFEAKLEGNFGKSLPAEQTLTLKEGAQIMFIRNDKGENRRYYNGKTGIIDKIEEDKIYVAFPGQSDKLLVEKETWRNVKYTYNKEEDKIEEDNKGSFTQYPIRLAWAITIHKSQGLTFDKAIIDAGESFAPGQVYVALSRLTSLNGLVLLSKINSDCIYTDAQASAFSQNEPEENQLNKELEQAKESYIHNSLINAFNWNKLLNVFTNFYESFDNRRIPLQEEAQELGEKLLSCVEKQENTASKFTVQLENLLSNKDNKPTDYNHLNERIAAASAYFKEKIHKELFNPIKDHLHIIKTKPKTKKYQKELKYLLNTLKHKKSILEKGLLITQGLAEGTDTEILLKELSDKKESLKKEDSEKTERKKAKVPKGETFRISLKMFKEGKNISDIAQERGLVTSTIENHLIRFISTDELNLEELVPKKKAQQILKAIKQLNQEEDFTLSKLKGMLGEEYTYGEIRAAIAYYKKMEDYSKID